MINNEPTQHFLCFLNLKQWQKWRTIFYFFVNQKNSIWLCSLCPNSSQLDLVSIGGDCGDTRVNHGVGSGGRALLLKADVGGGSGLLLTHPNNNGTRLAENHAADGVLWCREASHEGNHAKDADASTEHVESPAIGSQLEVHDGWREHIHVLVEDDGTCSSRYSCVENKDNESDRQSETMTETVGPYIVWCTQKSWEKVVKSGWIKSCTGSHRLLLQQHNISFVKLIANRSTSLLHWRSWSYT